MNDYVWKRPIGFNFSWVWAVKVLCFAVFLFLLTYLYGQIKTQKYFPISHVSVVGVQHADSLEIQHLLTPLVNKGFFSLDVALIRERLLQQAWIADATVQKTWPDQVLIHVIEKTPIAIWNANSLLSSTGEIFQPNANSYPANIPQFSGPPSRINTLLPKPNHNTGISIGNCCKKFERSSISAGTYSLSAIPPTRQEVYSASDACGIK